MICCLRPSSEYFTRFLATRMLKRVWSIQKFFSSGWVRLIACRAAGLVKREPGGGSVCFRDISCKAIVQAPGR